MVKYVVEFIKSTGKHMITVHDTKKEADDWVVKLLSKKSTFTNLDCNIYAVDDSVVDKIHKLLKKSGESQYEVSLF